MYFLTTDATEGVQIRFSNKIVPTTSRLAYFKQFVWPTNEKVKNGTYYSTANSEIGLLGTHDLFTVR